MHPIITLTQMYVTYDKAEKTIIKEVETTYQSLSGPSLGIHEMDDEIIIHLIEGSPVFQKLKESLLTVKMNPILQRVLKKIVMKMFINLKFKRSLLKL